MASRLELFAFRYRGPRTGKWVRARYRATPQEVASRYAEHEITGPPEIREVDLGARYFNPTRDERRAGPSFGNLGPILTIAGWRYSRRVAIAGSPD